MAIQSVAVESNGWVLAVTGSWGATPGAWNHSGDDRVDGQFLDGAVDQFPLDPDGTPKIVLSVERQGFARKGDRSVEASSGDVQQLIATKALRLPYPDQTDLDEVDNGNGTRTIRFALSDYVYDGDVINGATFLNGWKAGEDGGALGAGDCSNDSDEPLPVAISRWAQPMFQLVRGTTTFKVERIVASHHPRHHGIELHQALAGMALTATDGTTTVGPFWAQVADSDRGDGLRCWIAELDLDGLDAGPVSIHVTEYPWVGAARAMTTTHYTDTTDGYPLGWDNPQVICYDPDADLYPVKYVYVDASDGASSGATVGDTLADAKAGTHADSVMTALSALYAKNYKMPARNGWAEITTNRAMDFVQVVVAPGVHPFGTEAEGLNARTHEGYITISGDPDDTDPRANCILRAEGTATGKSRSLRWWFDTLSVEMDDTKWMNGSYMMHAENCEFRNISGDEAGFASSVFNAGSPLGYARYSMCGSTWWKNGTELLGSNRRFSLLRSCEVTRPHEAMVQINVTKPDDGFWDRSTALPAFTGYSTVNTDSMIWGCAAYDWPGNGVDWAGSRESGANTIADPYIVSCFAVVNTLVEGVNVAQQARGFRIGASPAMAKDWIVEGVALLGTGTNGFYDGGVDTNKNNASEVRLDHSGNRVVNSVFARHAIKGDIFCTNSALVGNWPQMYGVGRIGNVNANRHVSEASNFQFAYHGLNSDTNLDYANTLVPNYPGFVDDQSSAGDGWGDYHPDAGSRLLQRGSVASIDVDAGGTTRGAVFDTGAFETTAGSADEEAPGNETVPVVTLAILEGRHEIVSVSPGLQQTASLAVDGSRLILRDDGCLITTGAVPVRPKDSSVRILDPGVRLIVDMASRGRWGGRVIRAEGNDRTRRAGRD